MGSASVRTAPADAAQLDGRRQQLEKRYTSQWVWRAVAALVDTEDFQSSPQWIAQRLKVSVKETVEALEGLEDLGILRRTSHGYEKVLKFVYFSDRQLDAVSLLADHALVSTQILGRLNPLKPKDNHSFYRTGFVATNEQRIREFCAGMESLMKDFLEASAREPSDRVFAWTLSGVEVAESQGEEK